MAITYGGMTLLSVRSAEARQVGSAARRLARRIGLDVQGVNELVWPSGADRFGGTIGLIEEGRVAAMRELWEPWRDGTIPEPSEMPQLRFHDAPALPASLAAIEPIDGATGGLFLVALTDARRTLQEARFAAATDPTFADWATAIDAVGSDGPELILSHSIAGRLAPELDDPAVLTMTRGQWIEAAAWSVGGGWRLRSSGELELQSPSQAEEVEADNRAAAPGLVEGRYDQEPVRPIAAVRLCVRDARGAVPWPRGEALFDASATPTIYAGVRWNPRTTALWERAPVDASQENASELQALADALLADAQSWTGRTYKVDLAGFAPWHPSARDRTVRWIDRGRTCRTIIETRTTADLPAKLIHRSSVVPREPSLVEAITETSGSPGGSVTATLLAATGRPARQVTARFPSHPSGLSVSAGQSVWLDYDRSAGEWILVPWTTL